MPAGCACAFCELAEDVGDMRIVLRLVLNASSPAEVQRRYILHFNRQFFLKGLAVPFGAYMTPTVKPKK